MLLVLQETIYSRDREIASLKVGLKSASDSKVDLHAQYVPIILYIERQLMIYS